MSQVSGGGHNNNNNNTTPGSKEAGGGGTTAGKNGATRNNFGNNEFTFGQANIRSAENTSPAIVVINKNNGTVSAAKANNSIFKEINSDRKSNGQNTNNH